MLNLRYDRAAQTQPLEESPSEIMVSNGFELQKAKLANHKVLDIALITL